MGTIVLWFRRDLRLSDNAALWNAVKDGHQVLPVFVLNPDQPHGFGNAQKWWLHHSLVSLQESLKHLGASLVLRKGDHEEIIPEIAKEASAKAVYWNDLFEPWAAKSDETIKKALKNKKCETKVFNSSLLLDPNELKTKTETVYKVFTPFFNALSQKFRPRELYDAPSNLSCKVKVKSDVLTDWKLISEVDIGSEYEIFTPGEEAAKKVLKSFIESKLAKYGKDRDFPAKKGTTCLSPHIHFGEISVNQIWAAASKASTSESRTRFLTEIGWREFSYYLLYHFPDLPTANFRSEFDRLKWEKNEKNLEAWKNGMTGYPIVDAGMRELKETGYMHNRVRMIVASFLTKHLLIHWHRGAEWFWERLFDADLAANSASWQWVAGCGADAAPYFRIFNPILQGEKFDPEGTYIRRWVPEIKGIPNSQLNKPWTLATKNMKYPGPIVNHEFARKRALDNYAEMRRK